MQGFLQLMEPNVTVISRSQDVDVVTTASESAGRQYSEISGREINFEVDGSLSNNGYVTTSHRYLGIL